MGMYLALAVWTYYGLHIPSPTRVINVTDRQAARTTGQALLGWLLNRAKSLLCDLFREVIRNSTTEVSRPVRTSFISTLNWLKTKGGQCTSHGKNILLGLNVGSLCAVPTNQSTWMSAWRYELSCLSIVPLLTLLMPTFLELAMTCWFLSHIWQEVPSGVHDTIVIV